MVMRSQWVAPLTPTGLPNQSITSFGEQSGYPGFEARVQAVGKNFRLGVSGHWNQSHRAGIGSPETAALPDLITEAVQVGARLNVGPITLQGGGYAGKNLAPLLGDPAPGDL